MPIRFTKMHGVGNDFVCLDAVREPVPAIADLPAFARAITDRRRGVGADGLILILPPASGVDADLRMRIFNADGSEAGMCGNGLRCVCKYAREHGLTDARPMRVQSGDRVLSLEYTALPGGRVGLVTVDMGEPILEADRVPVRLGADEPLVDHPVAALGASTPLAVSGAWFKTEGVEPRMTCLSMGNPHAVWYCCDVGKVALPALGSALEAHPAFPEGVNVHVVQVHSRAEVSVRSWERGSGLTLGCGSGACAVCVAGVLGGRTDRHLLAHLPGGDLELHWDQETGHVFMTGPAQEVYQGEWSGEVTE